MKNFARVIRLALRYRYSIIASIACSLMVGFLWGANIATLYPVVEVVFRGDSLPEWATKRVAERELNCAKITNEVKASEKELLLADAGQRAELNKQLEEQQQHLASEQSALANAQKQQRYITQYLPDDPFTDLLLVVLLLIAGTILKSAFLASHIILVARIRMKAIFDLRNEFFRKTLNMDLASLEKLRTSGLLSRFTHDMGILENGVGTLFGQAMREPLKMAFCLAGAALISWQLLLLSLILTPIGILMMGWINRAMKRSSGESMDVVTEMYARISEAFSSIKVVKAFTMEQYEDERYQATGKEYIKRMMRFVRYFALFKPVSEVMGIAVVSLAILMGAYLVLNNSTTIFGLSISSQPLSPSALLLFFGMLAGIADPARKMTDIYAMLIGGVAAADRIYELIDRTSEIPETESPQAVSRPHTHLELSQVHFHYRKDEPVLKGIDLRIPYGETVVFVGANGCGKSTLINLIPRFFDPIDGDVTLDGISFCDIGLQDLRSRIGIVTQEPLLFDDTVMNNIRYGSHQATEEEAMQAAKKAHAHQFVMEKLESGYQSIVGQGGGWLSGGQRQRIALARAILRDPEILILDEATSQIDVESEKLIHQTLESFAKNRTTLIISHRLSTLALADRIVVMEAGLIIDNGTHEQLLARCRHYQQLYQTDIQKAA